MTWQLQDAKQRFSELVRRANEDGPQVVTRHGEEVAVVLSINEYRRAVRRAADFKDFLVDGPSFDGLDLERSAEVAPLVELPLD